MKHIHTTMTGLANKTLEATMQPFKVTVFLGLSIDGYIAGESGDLSWLSIVETNPPEDTGYEKLMSSADTIVIGRNTYDAVLRFNEWPYTGKRVIVLTHRDLNPRYNEEAYYGEISPLLEQLKKQGHKHIYLDGGMTVREGLTAGMVNEMILSRVPIILGRGVPLFVPNTPTSKWQLKESKVFPSGLLQEAYLTY